MKRVLRVIAILIAIAAIGQTLYAVNNPDKANPGIYKGGPGSGDPGP